MKQNLSTYLPLCAIGVIVIVVAVVVLHSSRVTAANLYSIVLNSSSGQYLSIDDSSQTGLDLSSALTIEAWVNPASQPTNTEMGIAGKDIVDNDQYNRGYNFEYGDLGGGGQQRGLQLFVSSDGSIHSPYNTYDIFNWEYSLPTDTWTHVAVTWDSSTKAANLYINGSLYSSSTGTNVSSIYDTSAPFRIGQHIGATSQQRYFDGKIDDVRVWNAIRNATDISAYYQGERSGTQSNLVGYWKLNYDSADATINGNNLTAINSPSYSTNVPSLTALRYAAYRTSNKSVSSDSAPDPDGELGLTLDADTTYSIEGAIFVTSTNATPDFKFDLAATSASAIAVGYIASDGSSQGQSGGVLLASRETGVVAVGANNTLMPIYLSGTITMSERGDVMLEWAQNTSHASAVSVTRGSYLRATEIE